MALTRTLETTDGCTLTAIVTLDDTATYGANPITVHVTYCVHALDDMAFGKTGQISKTFFDATTVTLASALDQIRDDIKTAEGM